MGDDDDQLGYLVNNLAPGTISRSKVNFVEFRFEDDGAAPATFHLNEIAAVPQPSSIVFDDGWGSTYTRARPNLDRFGYRATAVIIRDPDRHRQLHDPAAAAGAADQ